MIPVSTPNFASLAVLKGFLEGTAGKVDAALFRAAVNPTIAEAHEACHGLYKAETGATVVPVLLGQPGTTVLVPPEQQGIVDRFGTLLLQHA